MLYSNYEALLNERLNNVDSKSRASRNFIVGECIGVVRASMIDPDVSIDEAAFLWDLLAIQLQKLSLSDMAENSELHDNMNNYTKMYELCLSAVDGVLCEYALDEHRTEYEKGVIDGLILYCDIYCNCPDELVELKRKRNRIVYKTT